MPGFETVDPHTELLQREQPGGLIKIDFETNRGVPVTSYGKVVGMRREEIMGYIMNIMFTRVSRKNLNSINAFVYEYGDAG